MAQYRLLADHYINNQTLVAGTVVTTGVEVPSNFLPNANCEPLDTPAIQAFFDLGPDYFNVSSNLGVVRGGGASSVHWQLIGRSSSPKSDIYQLTGAGASLGPKHSNLLTP